MGMTIDFIIEEDDVVKEVLITASPIEYLVISSALKQFAENPNNHSVDIEVAKNMRKVMENHGND
jgi:hypothetical protein